jgi:chitin disaccharide deacetylase
MLIVNADDWGRSRDETDAALRCYEGGRITAVSAMVFMEDSERAAELAKGTELDVGLHLNLSEKFTGQEYPKELGAHHNKIRGFLRRSKYAQLVYNPWLRRAFSYSYEAQAAEFERLFGKLPLHIDGHHHMHLCANVILDNVIPSGVSVRRNFSFWTGEKHWLNRTYRGLMDRWLARRYRLADYFFDLTQSIQEKKLERVAVLAEANNVELMTHPAVQQEAEYLMSDEFQEILQRLEVGNYTLI